MARRELGFGNEYEIFAALAQRTSASFTAVSSTCQAASGDIDAAEAMIYNEIAPRCSRP
jgi:hypothetical protein